MQHHQHCQNATRMLTRRYDGKSVGTGGKKRPARQTRPLLFDEKSWNGRGKQIKKDGEEKRFRGWNFRSASFFLLSGYFLACVIRTTWAPTTYKPVRTSPVCQCACAPVRLASSVCALVRVSACQCLVSVAWSTTARGAKLPKHQRQGRLS
jgi:hypothetical protein